MTIIEVLAIIGTAVTCLVGLFCISIFLAIAEGELNRKKGSDDNETKMQTDRNRW